MKRISKRWGRMMPRSGGRGWGLGGEAMGKQIINLCKAIVDVQ